MNNTKKGFTLVELLVVIAILAILATVSVVGYTSFIDRANQSNAETEANQVKSIVEYALMDPTTSYVTLRQPSGSGDNAVSGLYVVRNSTTGELEATNVQPTGDNLKEFDASKDIPENGKVSNDGKVIYYTTDTHKVNVLTGASSKVTAD